MTAIALTIAGSDSGGCAGIQADLKTFSALGVFGTSAITAITAQNTLGVDAISILTPHIVSQQIHAVMNDIGANAIKTGMLANAEIVGAVCTSMAELGAPKLVVDPVMVATTGARLIDEAATQVLIGELAPMAILITPNLREAEVMIERQIASDIESLKAAAMALYERFNTSVMLKGGHVRDATEAVDLFVCDGHCEVLSDVWVSTNNTHGTGCTLSAAITAYLAKDYDLSKAVHEGKRYIRAAIANSEQLSIGQGNGPVHHFHNQW